MRRIIVLLILILLCWACYYTVLEGFNLGTSFSVANYQELQNASRSVDTLISQLVNINETEFPSKKALLDSTITLYKDKKAEYEELRAIVESTSEDLDLSLVDIYDVDFLWTTIGNYSTEEGIILKFDISKSLTSSINSIDYTICDLRFTVSGEYIPITDFIFDIENDSKLGFEISNFSMAKGVDNLQATFTVRNIPINNQNLTEITTSLDPRATDANGNVINGNVIVDTTNTTTAN